MKQIWDIFELTNRQPHWLTLWLSYYFKPPICGSQHWMHPVVPETLISCACPPRHSFRNAFDFAFKWQKRSLGISISYVVRADDEMLTDHAFTTGTVTFQWTVRCTCSISTSQGSTQTHLAYHLRAFWEIILRLQFYLILLTDSVYRISDRMLFLRCSCRDFRPLMCLLRPVPCSLQAQF